MQTKAQPLTVVLCGVGGYGETYVRALLRDNKDGALSWVGAVEPFPERCKSKAEIDAASVPWYSSLEEFYQANCADICVVAAPIQFHAELSILAMRSGSHVLCEKPLCALPGEASAMQKVRNETGKLLAVGFQWSYARAVLALKRDIMAGLYGAPIDLQCSVFWPRDHAYFSRGVGWAGKRRDAAGRWVLDTVANNATAHYIHNMLYVLGREGTSAMPEALTASLYRANPIEMYDTAFIEAEMGAELNRAKVRFLASHACKSLSQPCSTYTFEKGVIRYDSNQPETTRFVGTLEDGRTIDYGSPFSDGDSKLLDLAAAIQGERSLPCPLEAAMPHGRCMIASLLSCDIHDIPKELIEDIDGGRYAVEAIDALLSACAEENRLPRASDASWVAEGRKVRLDDPSIDRYGSEG